MLRSELHLSVFKLHALKREEKHVECSNNSYINVIQEDEKQDAPQQLIYSIRNSAQWLHLQSFVPLLLSTTTQNQHRQIFFCATTLFTWNKTYSNLGNR